MPDTSVLLWSAAVLFILSLEGPPLSQPKPHSGVDTQAQPLRKPAVAFIFPFVTAQPLFHLVPPLPPAYEDSRAYHASPSKRPADADPQSFPAPYDET